MYMPSLSRVKKPWSDIKINTFPQPRYGDPICTPVISKSPSALYVVCTPSGALHPPSSARIRLRSPTHCREMKRDAGKFSLR